MALTSSERQATYRARQASATSERRLNTWISSEAFHALTQLAHRQKLTQRAMLEQLILQAARTAEKGETENE